MLEKNILYVTGLPRAGSTLLCQLLGHHPEIYSIGHSSPLSHILDKLRRQTSDDNFLLAQLDVDFNLTYNRLLNAYRGFFNGWFAETEQPWVVDKNRGWLNMLETVNLIDPDCRMLVCVRELTQLYGSVEAQHQKTLLLDFPDHLAGHSRYARADALFKDDGVIGRPLRALQNVQDIPQALQKKLFYVVFEDLMHEPARVMNDIFRWLKLPAHNIDVQHLQVKPHESDSYYRFKYRHHTRSSLSVPKHHEVPHRIVRDMRKQFQWFYQLFYPDLVPQQPAQQRQRPQRKF